MNHFYQAVELNGKPCFKISSLFQTDVLAIMIFQNETAWEALVTDKELRAQSKKHTIDFQEYCKNLREYLHMCDNAQLSFKDGLFTISLMLRNKMKIQFFNVKLYQVNFHDSIFSLVDQLYNKNFEHLTELNSVKGQFDSLKNDYEILEKKMNEFLNRRQMEELNTYNNFLAIVNEKKRQIQHLNELLIAFRQSRPTVNPTVQVKRKKNNKKKIETAPKNESSLSDNETISNKSSSENESNNYNTDEEKESSNTKTIAIKCNQSPVPSTSNFQDYVLPDSPTQLFEFPTKRIRTGNNNLNCHLVISKDEEVKIEKEEEATSSNNSNNNVKNTKDTTVEYDTQDLLDNM